MTSGMSQKKFVTILTILLVVSIFSPTRIMAKQATTAADLVADETVIYVLPQVGNILPTHPLFPIKKLKDALQILTATHPFTKSQLLLHLADQYVAYAQRLLEMNRIESALDALGEAVAYRGAATRIIVDLRTTKENSQSSELQNLHLITLQSNVKQAEIIRSFLTRMPSGEQGKLIDYLDQTIQLRKLLE
jgi:hypothetical protein